MGDDEAPGGLARLAPGAHRNGHGELDLFYWHLKPEESLSIPRCLVNVHGTAGPAGGGHSH
jgi:hypothetical protein